MVIEASPRTLFLSIGKTSQVWLEVRSWTGWRVQKETGKGGTRIWWGWLEVAF